MIYQETIKIETNKAKRILELCKTRGIEIYDLFANSWSKAARSNTHRIKKQEKHYQSLYKEWSDFTRTKIGEIFLTPRMLIEFDGKTKKGEQLESDKFSIRNHVENILAPQIYFIEIIFNECDYYTQIEEQPPLHQAPIKKAIVRLFNIDNLLSVDLKNPNKELMN